MANLLLDKNGLAKSSGTLTVYNFNSVNGEFISSSEEFLPEGVGLPANSCITAPPPAKAGCITVYRDGIWQVVADNRGEIVYKIADGSAVLINEIGEYPTGTTPLKPTTTYDKWDGEKWVTDAAEEKLAAIESAKKQQIGLINEANSITQAWQTQLRLDIITDADKASLTEWMKYIQAVQSADISEEPEVIWPQKPL